MTKLTNFVYYVYVKCKEVKTIWLRMMFVKRQLATMMFIVNDRSDISDLLKNMNILGVLVIITIVSLKFYFIISEPTHVKLFLWTSSISPMFNFLIQYILHILKMLHV